MTREIFDIAVVGSGGGSILADTAMITGHRVALIEGTAWGGTCLNRGCIPTKIMVHAADLIRETQHAASMALDGQPLTINWQALRERVFGKIDEGASMPDYYASAGNVVLYMAMASFAGRTSVKGEELFALHLKTAAGDVSEILARKVVLANGGHTFIPQGLGLEDVGFATSESFFTPEGFPSKPYESLIIVGGGDIGCEFAHIFASFGTKVKLVQHNVRLVPRQDGEISARLLKILEHDGIEVYLNRDTVEAGRSRNGKTMRVVHRVTGEEELLEAEEIFVSPGIRANSPSLNLAAIGLRTADNGWIETNEYLETRVPGVYALGDLNGHQQLRHKSNYEATILAWNLLQEGASHPDKRRQADYDIVPSATFTAVQIGAVGLTEEQARWHHVPYKVGYLPFSATAQGYARGFLPDSLVDGFAKVLVTPDESRIIGVHILAPEASSLVQPYVYMMAAAKEPRLRPDAPAVVQRTMTIHPSLSELPAWAIGNWREGEEEALL